MRKRMMRVIVGVVALTMLAGMGGCSAPKPHFYTMSNTASVVTVDHNHDGNQTV